MARVSAAAFLGVLVLLAAEASGARLPGRGGGATRERPRGGASATAVFALGSFWRSEAAFGCLHGVIRTSVGYAGGSKANPEYRNLADHAECVKVEYDPRLIQYKQLLDVFWASHDPREVFGQGPDVGNQYRSIIFTNGTIEARLAALSKEREQAKDRSSVITTQIQPVGAFYPSEPEHQRVKLFRLNDEQGWDDYGAGQVTMDYLELLAGIKGGSCSDCDRYVGRRHDAFAPHHGR